MLEHVEELLPEHREWLFPPTETLSIFLAQALSPDGGCQQAVNDAALKRIVDGLPRCSSNTSAYCQARKRLPQEMITALTRQTGDLIAAAAPQWWPTASNFGWRRSVKDVGGRFLGLGFWRLP